MIIKVPLKPAKIVYLFAAFQGLAYYALIYLVAPLSPWKGYLKLSMSMLFLAVSVITFMVHYKQGKVIRAPLPWGVKWIAAYFIWSGISFFWGNSDGFDFNGVDLKLFIFFLWLNLLCEFLAMIFLCRCAPISEIVTSFFKGFRMGALILAIVLLGFWFTGSFESRLSGEGDVLQPIVAAMLFALAIFASTALFFQQRNHSFQRILKAGVFLSTFLFTLVLTVGKTALLSLPISFLLYICLVPSEKRTKTLMITFSGVVFLFSLPLIIPVLNSISYDTLTSLTGRVEVWQLTWSLIQQKPFAGYGMGSLVPELYWNRDTAGFTGQAHNLFINAWFQLGFTGFLIMLCFFLSFAYLSIQTYRLSANRKQAAFGLGIFVLMLFLTSTMSGLVGFYIPVQYLTLVLFWMSPSWNLTSSSTITTYQIPATNNINVLNGSAMEVV